MLRILRLAALAVGFPLVIALALAAGFVGFRLAQAKWFPSVAEPERLEQKRSYLDSLGSVHAEDPTNRTRAPCIRRNRSALPVSVSASGGQVPSTSGLYRAMLRAIPSTSSDDNGGRRSMFCF